MHEWTTVNNFCFAAMFLSDFKEVRLFGSKEIIEDGKYDDLISKDGYFAKLVKRQRIDA